MLLLSIVLRYFLLPLICSLIHFLINILRFSNIVKFSNIVRLKLFDFYVFELVSSFLLVTDFFLKIN